MTAWDLRALARAFAIGALAFLLAWLVTAATDEGGVAWGVRAGRTLPMTPACAAIGAWIALAPGRARGEIRALEALGRAPWQNALGAAAGGALTALVAASAMGGARAVDVTGFFPVAGKAVEYVYDAGTWSDRVHGWRVEVGGRLARIDPGPEAAEPPAPPEPIPPHGRLAAALATAFAGVALPLLAATVLLGRGAPDGGGAPPATGRFSPASPARAAALVAAMVALSIVLFHAAAALRIPALVVPVPAALLAVAAVVALIPPRKPS